MSLRLSQLVHILGRTINSQPELSNSENLDLVNVVTDYTYALDTIDRYDYQKDIGVMVLFSQ